MYNLYTNGFTEQEINMILSTINCEKIESLRHHAFNFLAEDIEGAVAEGISTRKFIKNSGRNIGDYKATLKDHQTVGVAFMYHSKRCILGDQVAQGKTMQIAALINVLVQKREMKRVLMFVEGSSIGQIQHEMMQRTGFEFIASSGDKKSILKLIGYEDWGSVAGVILPHSAIKSDTLFAWLAENASDGKLNMFDMVVLDESYVIKNDTTKAYEYFSTVCGMVDRVYLLNATTLEMNLKESYNQINIVRPGLLPKWSTMQKEFCVYGLGKPYFVKEDGKAVCKKRWEFKHYINQSKFKEACRLVFIARDKKDKVKHNYEVAWVTPTAYQIDCMAMKYNANTVLNSPKDIPEIEFNRKEVPKLDKLLNIVQEERFAGKKIMIYCWNTLAQKVIKNELELLGRNVVIMSGKENTSRDERFEVQKGVNEGEIDILVTNIKRALNLWGAEVCIIYSLETNPSGLEQIRGRIDRNVDDKIRTFILMAYEGTVEEEKLTGTIKNRAEAYSEFMYEVKTAIDFFIESM